MYLKEGTTASEELGLEMFEWAYNLTKDPVTEICCEEILAESSRYYNQVVYFGPAEDVKMEGKKGYSITQISVYHKYEFSEQNVGFYYNDDKECAKEYGLDEDKQYAVMFNANITVPYIKEIPD